MDYPRYYIQEFKKYLSLQTSSTNTIKNYLSDLRLFFNFITENQRQNLVPQSLPFFISFEFLKSYEDHLSRTTPAATTKRRLSSLKKFIDYCATQDISPAPLITPTAPPPPPPLPSEALAKEGPPPPSFSPPSYSNISHPLPPDFSPPSVSPSPDISNLVQTLADQVPTDASPTPAPQPSPPPPSGVPTGIPPFSASPPRPINPFIVASASFLVTFLLTFLISLFLTRS